MPRRKRCRSPPSWCSGCPSTPPRRRSCGAQSFAASGHRRTASRRGRWPPLPGKFVCLFWVYMPTLPFKATLSQADGWRKKASPTTKNKIGRAQLCYGICWTWVRVSHPRTNKAQCCLTSVIEREPVFQHGYVHRTFLTSLYWVLVVSAPA